MDHDNQKNHLKAYGIVYYSLEVGLKSKWLLNYDGGAFLIENNKAVENECRIRGVSYQVISDAKSQIILQEISSPSSNQEAVTLEKAPKIAVYSPKDKMPWDDAVTMVLTYAEIPFDVIYDKEVLADKLLLYEWLHLHHEDFTGQYGKFYGSFRTAPWYIQGKKDAEKLKKQGIQEKLHSIGLIEQASIAQKVIESFPIADFQKLRPMLSSEGEIKKAVQEFNSKLGSQYEEMLLVEFGGEEPLPIRSDYEPLLKKIMDIGYRAILKEYCLLGSRSQEDMGGQTSREISDSGTWEDIKSRI